QDVSGWWTDLGEPELHPPDMQHHLGSAAKIHNIFSLLWSKILFDGYASFRPQERLFNLTRAGFAGMQKYGTFPWSGDVRSTFTGLAVQIPMMLGMSMSGVAYQHSDLSGFTGNPSPELYVRWMQLGAFSPIARAHGADDTHQTEPWAYGATAEAIVKRYLQLRYRLLPYSYTMAHENHITGMPLARPLVLEYPDDPNVYNLGNEYFWGADFLVAPVTQAGATSWRVYLPEGEWVDYWTDKIYSGSVTINANAPLETLPLFVKTGAIIPLQNIMNYSDEFPLDTLTLAIYPAQRSSFTLYEDDGKTMAYRAGAFTETAFICDVQPQAVTVNIGRSNGDYAGKPSHRVYFTELHHISHAPDVVTKNAIILKTYNSMDELQRSSEGWWYDAAKQLLVVKCQTVPSEDYVLLISGDNLVSSISSEPTLPAFFQLRAPHPNPLTETTQIAYQLTQRATVQVEIFNLVGQHLKTLVKTTQHPGEHAVAWRGDDDRGLRVAAGVYVVRVKVNAGNKEFLASRKVSVLR
ncbi:MAG: TIM-barrel domain-containing protein, partial [bacterium]